MANFEAKNTPCAACGLEGDGLVCFHHIKSRKAHSELTNEPRNMIPLCLTHHSATHNRGLEYMATKYSGVKKFLTENNWQFCEIRKKWEMR